MMRDEERASLFSSNPPRLQRPAVVALAGILLLVGISLAGSVVMASPSGIFASGRGTLEEDVLAPDAARGMSASLDAQERGLKQGSPPPAMPAAIATPPAPDPRVYLPLVAVSYDSLVPVISSLSPVQGTVGEKVVIGGQGFGASRDQASHVFLHDVPIPDDLILAWSDDQITIRIPAEATTGSVVVLVGDRNSGGAWFTVTSPFVEPQPDEIAVDSLTGETVVRDELLLGFWPGTPPDEIASVLDGIGGNITGHDWDTDRYQIKIPGADPAGIQALMDDLAGNIYLNHLSPHIVLSEPWVTVPELEADTPAGMTEAVSPSRSDQLLHPADSRSTSISAPADAAQGFEDEVIRLVNEERTSRGLRPLLRNDNLTPANSPPEILDIDFPRRVEAGSWGHGSVEIHDPNGNATTLTLKLYLDRRLELTEDFDVSRRGRHFQFNFRVRVNRPANARIELHATDSWGYLSNTEDWSYRVTAVPVRVNTQGEVRWNEHTGEAVVDFWIDLTNPSAEGTMTVGDITLTFSGDASGRFDLNPLDSSIGPGEEARIVDFTGTFNSSNPPCVYIDAHVRTDLAGDFDVPRQEAGWCH